MIDSRIAIAIPASLTTEAPSLQEKTFKVGLVGRAVAIFRINEVIIYLDRPGVEKEGKLIDVILRYMESPQYLRKRLFPIMPELRYAGTLPPLRTPHHPLEDKGEKLKAGSFRDGVVVKSDEEKSIVDIGIEGPVPLPVGNLPVGKRITIKVVKPGKVPFIELAKPDEIREYWGFSVHFLPKPLGRVVKEYGADLVIATSKYGTEITRVIDELSRKFMESKRIFILFGSPTEGLREILARENLKVSEVAEFVVNTIPNQGTETVRTEEAIYATLSIFNTFTISE